MEESKMLTTEASELKAEANAIFAEIQTLTIRIQKREGNLCQYDGAKLKQKKGDIQKIRQLKNEKTQTLKRLNQRIPEMWMPE